MLAVDLQLDDMTHVGESIPRSRKHCLQRHRDGWNAARVLRRHDGLERRTPEAELLHGSARRGDGLSLEQHRGEFSTHALGFDR